MFKQGSPISEKEKNDFLHNKQCAPGMQKFRWLDLICMRCQSTSMQSRVLEQTLQGVDLTGSPSVGWRPWLGVD